jgi:UDP-N-acetyl-D-mannosaminuronic acid dehydrogenase
VNDHQPHFVVDLVRRALGGGPTLYGLSGRRIAVLGLSYKADVDDLRESPAVDAANLLAKAGARVTAYEPYRQDARFEGFETAPNLEHALAEAEALVLLVGHTIFRQLVPSQIAALTPARLALDTVNAWADTAWQSAGFQLYKLGVGKPAMR